MFQAVRPDGEPQEEIVEEEIIHEETYREVRRQPRGRTEHANVQETLADDNDGIVTETSDPSVFVCKSEKPSAFYLDLIGERADVSTHSRVAAQADH